MNFSTRLRVAFIASGLMLSQSLNTVRASQPADEIQRLTDLHWLGDDKVYTDMAKKFSDITGLSVLYLKTEVSQKRHGVFVFYIPASAGNTDKYMDDFIDILRNQAKIPKAALEIMAAPYHPMNYVLNTEKLIPGSTGNFHIEASPFKDNPNQAAILTTLSSEKIKVAFHSLLSPAPAPKQQDELEPIRR